MKNEYVLPSISHPDNVKVVVEFASDNVKDFIREIDEWKLEMRKNDIWLWEESDIKPIYSNNGYNFYTVFVYEKEKES